MSRRTNPRRRNHGRSRSLARTEERSDRIVEHALKSERTMRGEPRARPLRPCLGCGCILRSRRKFFKGTWGWAPFCYGCWVERGKPTAAESLSMAEEIERKEARAKESERIRRVEAGEAPW